MNKTSVLSTASSHSNSLCNKLTGNDIAYYVTEALYMNNLWRMKRFAVANEMNIIC